MNKCVKIGKCYKVQYGENEVRLCSNITMPDQDPITLYFEIDKRWQSYLVDELSDAFVLAIIKKAMKHSWDISFETPMSEDLYYQLVTYGIPVLSQFIEIYHSINLFGKLSTQKILSENKVGTGFSAGVDSFYTVLKHKDTIFLDHNITHLVLARNGAASSSEPEKEARRWFDSTNTKLAEYAKKLNLEYIPIWSNIPDVYWKDQCKYGDIIVTAAFVHCLRKLFGTYYWASAYQANVLDFSKCSQSDDGGYIEPFTVPLMSVSGLRFYLSGSEVSRLEKVKFISNYKIVQESITVCGSNNGENCGHCIKCLRTMAELKAVGKLSFFKKSFPITNYEKHPIWNFAYELAADHPPFTTEIINEMKRNNKKIGPIIYICKWIFCKPILIIRKKLSHNYLARKVYYKFNLDNIFDSHHSEEKRKRVLDDIKNS